MTDPLPIGATIGILGGGQLGRMLAMAAADLGLHTHIYDPADACPASHVATAVTTAAYDDTDALFAFADAVDVITYEFENIPTAALDLLEMRRPIRPNRRALSVSQDRLSEKNFLQSLGLSLAPFLPVDTAGDLPAALRGTGTPAILKTRRFGYDGKGQVRIADPGATKDAETLIANTPAILEGFVTFSQEISVIGARGLSGEIACYDPGTNVHRDGILHTTTVPAQLSNTQRTDAILIAGQILNALDYVGVMGVELFVTATGLLVNEIAPRVHNSGHWTQDGCVIDQFEQHIRAIAGWPLGNGARHSDVEMLNLIGDDLDRIGDFAKDSNCAIHLYGKSETRPGRKMGHVNRLVSSSAASG